MGQDFLDIRYYFVKLCCEIAQRCQIIKSASLCWLVFLPISHLSFQVQDRSDPQTSNNCYRGGGWTHCTHSMFQKCWPILYSKSLLNAGQAFLDIQNAYKYQRHRWENYLIVLFSLFVQFILLLFLIYLLSQSDPQLPDWISLSSVLLSVCKCAFKASSIFAILVAHSRLTLKGLKFNEFCNIKSSVMIKIILWSISICFN